MTDTINNLFEKLKDYEKREFLIKNIMKDKFFDKYHKTFDSDFITFIYSKEEQEQKIKQRDNNLFVNNFILYLRFNYKPMLIPKVNARP